MNFTKDFYFNTLYGRKKSSVKFQKNYLCAKNGGNEQDWGKKFHSELKILLFSLFIQCFSTFSLNISLFSLRNVNFALAKKNYALMFDSHRVPRNAASPF